MTGDFDKAIEALDKAAKELGINPEKRNPMTT